MYVFWGTLRCGKIDAIPGESHVATMFFHLQFVPLIPLYSVEVSERVGEEEYVTKVPFSFRSWMVAWGKCLLWASVGFTCIEPFLTPFHLLKRDLWLFAITFGGSIAWCLGLYLGLRWLASPSRAGISTGRLSSYPSFVHKRKPIVIECSFCRTKMRLREELAGKQIRCKACEEPIDVPGEYEEATTVFSRESMVPRPTGGQRLLKWGIGGSAMLIAMVAVAVTVVSVFNQPVANPPPPNRQIARAPEQPLPPHADPAPPQIPAHVEPAPPQIPVAFEAAPPQVPVPELDLMPERQEEIPTSESPFPFVSPEENNSTPVIAPRSFRRRPIPQRSSPSNHANNSKAVRSRLAGGDGGQPFQIWLNGSAMTGVDWSAGTWDGENVIGSILPVAIASQPTPGFLRATAPAGYAVGGINVNAPRFVCNVQLVFMKLRDNGTLDRNDKKPGEWLGGEPHGDVISISGNGKRVVGLYGRRAAVVDAIGLLLEP